MPKRAARSTSTTKRIYLVEDHPTFRQGLTQILNKTGDLAICGAAEDFNSALRGIRKSKPDLVLIDITLPGKSGLELVKRLHKSAQKLKLLVLSMHDEALYADRVLRAGGDGYIMKQEDPEEIVHAIRDVLAGHVYVSEAVFAERAQSSKKPSRTKKQQAFDDLTDQELEVLAMLGQGKNASQIARQLKLSVKEIEALGLAMRRKLDLSTSLALVRYAVCWVETGET